MVQNGTAEFSGSVDVLGIGTSGFPNFVDILGIGTSWVKNDKLGFQTLTKLWEEQSKFQNFKAEFTTW
jgi:hypothetical protein